MELTWHHHSERERLQREDEAAVLYYIPGDGRRSSSAVGATVACLCFLSVSALVLLPPPLLSVAGEATDASSSLSPDSKNALSSSRAPSSLSTSPQTFGNQAPSLLRPVKGRVLLQNLRPSPRLPPPPGSRSTKRAATRTLMFTAVPGSYPPRCTAKCGHCTPCKPVHVPVPPGRLVTTMEYYPEAWRCKCANVLYMP